MRSCRLALVAASLLCPVAAPAMSPGSSSEMRQYVRARLADAAGMPAAAATSYARLLAEAPDDKPLALRTYRQALTAGNFKLASLAAHHLDRAGALPPDAVLMLLADAVDARDWKAANSLVGRIEREQVFGFLVPVMRGWIAFGQKSGNALKLVAPRPGSQLANAYARDHHLLIALASGRKDMLVDLNRMVAASDPRAMRLQLAAGALLAQRGETTTALTILQGRGPELANARAAVAAGKAPAGAVDSPALGLSELFAQLAVDVKGDGRSPISLQLARLATYLAPDNAAAAIATADLLSSNGYPEAALAMLERIPADSPLADAARQERGNILLATGNPQEALAGAKRAASEPDADISAFIELGAILTDLERHAEAAGAYQRAIDLDHARGKPNWTYLFLKAGALDRSGDWTGAKALLRQANKVDPAQPIVLNYLGYGMLDRDENLAEAQIYIERASALDPHDAAITDSLGWLHYKRGNYPAAIAALERAIVGDPGEPVINEHLGDAYWAAGRRIEARYAWRAALVQADKPSIERITRKLTDGPGAALSAK